MFCKGGEGGEEEGGVKEREEGEEGRGGMKKIKDEGVGSGGGRKGWWRWQRVMGCDGM